MSDALTRILNDARDFFDKVEQLKRATSFNAADVRDAYGRLNRLRERYVKEGAERALDPDEAKALAKVFDDDVFIKGMLDVRQVSEHVQKRSGGGPILREIETSRPIPLEAQVSAGALFARHIYTVHRKGQADQINHLKQLEEAERRIKGALDRATKKPETV